jgi:hypothetical protein
LPLLPQAAKRSAVILVAIAGQRKTLAVSADYFRQKFIKPLIYKV